MPILYAVTHGSYADEHVVALYTTIGDALSMAHEDSDGIGNIQVFAPDLAPGMPLPPDSDGNQAWSVRGSWGGVVVSNQLRNGDHYSTIRVNSHQETWSATIWAPTEQEACRIAQRDVQPLVDACRS